MATQMQKPIGSRNGSNKDLSEYWSKHGIADVDYQRQAMLTWWSILGGLATGALLTQVPTLYNNFNHGAWQHIFFFITSALLIISNWINFSWGALIVKSQLRTARITIIFFGILFLSIQCLFVNDPIAWSFFVALHLIANLIWNIYESKSWTNKISDIVEKRGVLFLNLEMIIGIGLSLIACLVLHFFPSQIIEIAWGIIALVVIVFSIVSHNKSMEQERVNGNIP
jgi:hypothetical protein